MKKQSVKKNFTDCSSSDPSTFDCADDDFLQCVIDKHHLYKADHDDMVVNSAVPPRFVDLDGLTFNANECGESLIRIVFDPEETETNEDISVSIVNWEDEIKKFKKNKEKHSTELCVVYYSVILFNALVSRFGINQVEMRKAMETAGPSVVILCRNSMNMVKYRGNLTSQVPFYGDALP